MPSKVLFLFLVSSKLACRAENGSVVKCTYCSCGEPTCSCPQHPHGGLQPSLTPIPEDPTPSSTSEHQGTCGIHTYAGKKTHNFFKKENWHIGLNFRNTILILYSKLTSGSKDQRWDRQIQHYAMPARWNTLFFSKPKLQVILQSQIESSSLLQEIQRVISQTNSCQTA